MFFGSAAPFFFARYLISPSNLFFFIALKTITLLYSVRAGHCLFHRVPRRKVGTCAHPRLHAHPQGFSQMHEKDSGLQAGLVNNGEEHRPSFGVSSQTRCLTMS